MIQTATVNYHSPAHTVLPSGLAGLHPTNVTNINGRIISRSPTAFPPQDQRNLSPNKLNATKKPMIGNNPNGNALIIGNFTSRGRTNASPSPRGANVPFANGLPNYNNNNVVFANNNGGRPLLNSGGYHPGKYEPQRPTYNHNKQYFCENHHNKVAEFYMEADNQESWYCQKCAINLASKGFTVIPRASKNQSREEPQKQPQHRLEQFYFPQLMGAPGYSEVEQLVSTIDNTYHSYQSQISKYESIDSHYRKQYSITQHFYQSLLDLVEQMKNDHLADLESQAKKHSQIALIKQDHLKSELEQIIVIRNDITQNLEVILNGFDEKIVQDNLGMYRQAILGHQDKIEQESAEFGKLVIDEKEGELQLRLKKIEEFLLDIWNDQEKGSAPEQNKRNNGGILVQAPYRPQEHRPSHRNQDKSPKSVKNILNLNPKNQGDPKNQRQGTACRRLFDDDLQNQDQMQQNQKCNNNFNDDDFQSTEELHGQKSPQFKNI